MGISFNPLKTIKDTATGVVNKAKEVTQKAVNTTKDVFEKGVEKAKEVKQAVGDKVNEVKENVGKAVKATGEAIGKAAKATGEAVGNATKAVGEAVSNMSASEIAHHVLGAASFVPGVGAVAAVVDAGLHAAEGNFGEAALSLAGAIPGGKVATTAVKGVKAATSLAKGAKAGKGAKAAQAQVTKATKVKEDAQKVYKAAQDKQTLAQQKAGAKANTSPEVKAARDEKYAVKRGDLKKASANERTAIRNEKDANQKLTAAQGKVTAAKEELKAANKELLHAVKPSTGLKELKANPIKSSVKAVAAYGAQEATKKVVEQNGGPEWAQGASGFGVGKLVNAALNIKGR
ncbi:MAG: hypothetical protein FWG75_07525 [Cystobacterineae bacterium]|nr:hypothetical protein [Cystobacterineae bacterium]